MFRVVILKSTLLVALLSVSACVTTRPEFHREAVRSQADIRAEMAKSAIPRQIRDKIIHLHHRDPVERAWAAYQLAKLGRGASPAIPYLVELLDDETPVLLSRYLGGGYRSSSDTTPADEAARALSKMGELANPELIKALQHPLANTRRLAAKALGQIGETESIKHLIKTLDDPDRRVRASAAISLGHYHHPMAAQIIVEAIPSSGPSARADMIYALAQINDIIVVPFLMKRLATEEANVRAAIVYALGKMRDARAVEPLLKGLSDKDELVRANSAYALSSYYAPRVIDALIRAMDDEVMRVREAAGEALAVLTGKQYGIERDKWHAWWQLQKQAMQQNSIKQ